ncbi:MAG: hypothetical protein AAGJ18_20020 [Bacteroidota bacterium]
MDCGVKHPINKGRRERCRRVKACKNRGADLKAKNLLLYEAYETACEENQDWQSGEQWACKTQNPEDIFNNYRWSICGFNPATDSLQGELFNESERVTAEVQAKETRMIIGVGALLALLVLYLVVK